ncbi:MAG: TRAP transporter small permease [Alphaproteobacteria bacterium]|nr:TRAP transporter small permease [Alphaproteobacteria bacterium]
MSDAGKRDTDQYEMIDPTMQTAAFLPKGWLSFEALTVIMNTIGTALIFGMMAMISTDILFRYLLNSPFDGVTELTEVGIVAVVFLQGAHSLRSGRFIRSDAFYTTLLNKVPKVGHFLGTCFDLGGCFMLAFIALGSYPKMITAWNQGYYVGNVGVFTFPEWPSWALIVIGSAVLSLQFLLLAANHFLVLIGVREASRAESRGAH